MEHARWQFVLRWWEHQPDWGSLTVVPGDSDRPAVFIGFVRLSCDPVFAILAWEHSLARAEGMREAWFYGHIVRAHAATDQ